MAALRADPSVSGVQFHSMLWRLLGHALDLSNPESDTLVEDALRLLVSVLGCTTALTPALQVPLRLTRLAALHPRVLLLCLEGRL